MPQLVEGEPGDRVELTPHTALNVGCVPGSGSDANDCAGDPATDDPPGDALMTAAARALRALIMAGEHYRVDLAAATGLGTTESQAVGYLYLHRARGQTQLATDLGLTGSAATALVDRLHRRGVATRTPHPSDRRRTLVRLTEHGETLAKTSQEALLDALSSIPRDGLPDLTRSLDALATQLHSRGSTGPAPVRNSQPTSDA